MTEKPEHKKGQPVYLKVYTTLKLDIVNGTYPVGTLLPSEPKLCEMFFASRTTIRKAVSLLTSDGLVRVQQGFGTQVLSRRVSQNLGTQVTSISQTLEQKGYQIGTKNMYIQVIPCPDELSRMLCIAKGKKIAVINRIQTADGLPVAISKNYIPYELVEGIESETDKIISLYKYLNEHYHISITSMKNTISACPASFEDAGLLEIEPGSALLTVKRICFTGKIPIEFDDVKIVAEKYEFEI